MKIIRIIYWISTGIVSLMMLYSSYLYMTSPDLKAAFVHLGFPDWFREELGVAKFLGAIALIVPVIPARVKEWAYAGFFINFFSAFLAHLSSGDESKAMITPLVLLAILIISYVSFHKTREGKF